MSHKIKNFSIIAHIDHGKSTLADRLIEFCATTAKKRKVENQILDSLEVEKQRGITVKSQTVRLDYFYKNEKFALNLIDTPGHVDFSLEVKRALCSSESAIILIDATQGIEAQTIANVYKAMEENLFLLPVINKIDLQSAQVDFVKEQIISVLGITTEPVLVSAKTGLGIENLVNTLCELLPVASKNLNGDFLALLIDSWFDNYLGVILLVRIKQGKISLNSNFKFYSNNCVYKVEKIAYLRPEIEYINELSDGEVGIIIANIRTIKDCTVGDTISSPTYAGAPLKSFPEQRAAVFCGLFPEDQSQYKEMKESIEKLALNDSSLKFETTNSSSLGMGVKCGFLGLLHLEVTTQRLQQEFNINVIVTSPNVLYKIITNKNETIFCSNANEMPETSKISQIFEPWVKVTIFSPETYLGDIIKLCIAKRAQNQNLQYVNQGQSLGFQNISCQFDMPLSEIIFDFHDKLKSLTKGYASFDYEETEEQETKVAVVDILINEEKMENISSIIHKDSAQDYGKWACETLKNHLDKQMFKITIQAAISGKIIARETISPYRKDVIAKCYGGDVTRKKKLLEKQKAGKEKMAQIGIKNKLTIPNSAILAILTKK